MLHANAALTPARRLELGRLIVEEGWPTAWAAKFFAVSWTTADRWARRYRAEGKAGMVDRCCRPHTSPAKTDPATTKRIVSLRLRKRWGAVRLAAETGVAPSTAGAVLRRCGISRLSRLERRDQQVVRYEREAPGDLLHADVKKLGNIPAGGGWRFLGRARGGANRTADGGRARSRHHHPLVGRGYIHVVLDDHSRVAYAEICEDETGPTAAAVLRRATAWFAVRGVTARRVLTDNGGCYRSRDWAGACAELGITAKRTRPYRPQTNGKVERFHRTMTSEWAFAQLFTSEADRRAAFPGWLHAYNHHRPHTGIGGHSPISRLTNLPGQYTALWSMTLRAIPNSMLILKQDDSLLDWDRRCLYAQTRAAGTASLRYEHRRAATDQLLGIPTPSQGAGPKEGTGDGASLRWSPRSATSKHPEQREARLTNRSDGCRAHFSTLLRRTRPV